MPIYDDRVASSGLWARIEEIVALTESLPDDLPPAESEQVQRVRSVAQYFGRLVRHIDGEFLSPNVLNSLDQHFTNSSSELREYLSSRNAAHLSNVDSYVDAALSMAPFAYSGVDDEADGYAQRLSSFRRSAGQQLANLEREFQAIRSSIEDLASRFSLQTVDTDGRLASINTSTESVLAQLRVAEERVTLLGTSLQQTVEADRQRWESEIQADLVSRKNDFADAVTNVVAGVQNQIAASEVQAALVLERLTELEKKAVITVSTMGGIALVGGYANYAVEQKAEADRWRKLTIRLGSGATVVAAASVFWTAVSDDVRWDLIAAKFTLTIVIFGLAAYCSSQSAAHRERERQARHVEVELASLPSYVKQLDDKAVDVLVQIALRRFGHAAPTKSLDSDVASTKSLVDTLAQALSALGKQ